MKNRQFLFAVLFLFMPLATLAKPIPFSILTKDKLTKINGQIDLPNSKKKKLFPLVLLVGGTHLFDRDYDFGSSNSDKDLLFREISKQLTAKGFAVARYDYRGVNCNKRTVPTCTDCKTNDEFMAYFIRRCIDNSIRSTVTTQTTRDDIEVVYNFAKSQSFVKHQKKFIIAHSEGTIHVSNLVQEKKVDPSAILLWGFVAESPKDIFKWQWTERSLSALLQSYGIKRGENLTNESIKLTCKKLNIAENQCQELLSPKGFFTTSDLEAQIDDQYETVLDEALSHQDKEPFKYVWSKYGAIFSTYDWWKMWFTDSQPNIRKLFNYHGKLSFINGTIDMATPSVRELSIVNSNVSNFKSTIHINEVEEVGHGLGPNPANGPISESSMKLLLSEIHWLNN